MSRYEPLEQFLRQREQTEVPMTFAEIERIIGRPLPKSAHTHRAWWSNNPSNNVMTKSWLAAGYVTERVDMGSQRLVFRKDRHTGPTGRPGAAPQTLKLGVIDRLRAALTGTVTVAPGVDLTEPAGGRWEAER